MASTVSRMATPGHTLIHQASRIMVRAAPIMKPQLIRLRSPRPRNDSDDSVRIAVATMNEAETMMGDMALGRIWVHTMRPGVCPITMAACTNSRCLSVMNSERTRRAAGGHDTSAMAPMMEYTEGPT